MSEYKESDLPVAINHEEFVTLPGGACVRFESNGEAKDVFIRGEFSPVVQLFPDCDYEFEDGGKKYRVKATFEDKLLVDYA